MIGYSMLEELLGSKVRARMIAALLVAPDQRLHLRALVRSAGGSVASVQREVERLGDMGLVRSETDEHGRRQVSLVGDHPFAPALAGLVAADPRAQYGARVAAVPNLDAHVAEALGGWVDAIVTGFDPIQIVLFGSQANGTADAGSDVDLLVVLPEVGNRGHAMVAIKSAIGRRTIGLDVIPTDPADIARQRIRKASVVRDALEEGVTIYERPA
ncbi:MAG: nucleotidyltransferase domain-containing protein [Actinomycetota bacterium]|nr:MAG: ArsR family transcriptional [Actinomycetota bacterium]MDO8950534.1 nucleotidyltransferase domain-containing protein [Actinomycetota bacterium]MDP3630803.1 nucleotidyltransferase domain-containing protein [Actinomycetota bacterium]